MNQSRLLALFIAVLIGLSARAVSAADILPGEAVGEDVVCVLWFDAEKLDAKALRAAAKVLISDPKTIEESIGALEKTREAFVKAGGASFSVVFRGPDSNGRPPEPFMLLTLKEKTDPDAAKEAISKMGGPPAEWIAKLSDRALVISPPRWRPAGVEPGDTHKAFEKLFASSGDAPAKIVFMPNDALKGLVGAFAGLADEIDRDMPGGGALMLLGEQACAMKHITVALTAGEAPKLVLHAEAADAEGAKLLGQKIKAGTEGLKKMAEKIKTQGRSGAEASPVFAALADLGAIEPKVDGGKLTLTVDATPLKNVAAAMMVSVIAAQQQAKEAVFSSQMHQLTIAIHAYAADNDDALPDKLEDLAKYVGGAEQLAKLMQHPVTGEKVGISYVKPAKKLSDIQRPEITAMLFEMREGKIQPNGSTGYADGHVTRGRSVPRGAPPEDRKKE